MLVRQATDHLIGQHGLEHGGAVAAQRGVDGELLGGVDPTQVLTQDRWHRHPVTGVNAVGVGNPHALGDGAIGQGGHLTRVGEVHRQGPRLAGHHGADEISHQLARAPGGDLVGSHQAPDRGVVVVLVGFVPGDAVVVHSPGTTEIGFGGDEAGEEFHHVGVGGSG